MQILLWVEVGTAQASVVFHRYLALTSLFTSRRGTHSSLLLPLPPLLLGPHLLFTKPGAPPAVPTVWILSHSCPVSYSALVLYQAGSWCYRVGNMASETFTYSTINLDEPEPLANKQSTILGVVISFMVRS